LPPALAGGKNDIMFMALAVIDKYI